MRSNSSAVLTRDWQFYQHKIFFLLLKHEKYVDLFFLPVKCKEFVFLKNNLQNDIGDIEGSIYRPSCRPHIEVNGLFMTKSLHCFDILVNQMYMS